MQYDCIQYVDTDVENGPKADSYEIDEKAKAQENVICTECGRTIIKGVVHTHETGVWEGYRGDYRTCSDCLSVRKSFFLTTGWRFEMMWADLGEHIYSVKGEVGEIHISCLTEHAREIVCDCVERAQAGVPVHFYHVQGNHPALKYVDGYHLTSAAANKQRLELQRFGYEAEVIDEGSN